VLLEPTSEYFGFRIGPPGKSSVGLPEIVGFITRSGMKVCFADVEQRIGNLPMSHIVKMVAAPAVCPYSSGGLVSLPRMWQCQQANRHFNRTHIS
jgi:hypothetical protein